MWERISLNPTLRHGRFEAETEGLESTTHVIIRPSSIEAPLADRLLRLSTEAEDDMTDPAATCETTGEPEGCGILLHQRPMLQKVMEFDDPVSFMFFTSWISEAGAALTDESLAEATTEVDGVNLLFLKANIDGRPEIINIEFPVGEVMTVERLTNAEPTICVHLTNDPASGFYLRNVEQVELIAPIRNWQLHGQEAKETRSEIPV